MDCGIRLRIGAARQLNVSAWNLGTNLLAASGYRARTPFMHEIWGEPGKPTVVLFGEQGKEGAT